MVKVIRCFLQGLPEQHNSHFFCEYLFQQRNIHHHLELYLSVTLMEYHLLYRIPPPFEQRCLKGLLRPTNVKLSCWKSTIYHFSDIGIISKYLIMKEDI